jgi:tetratricopeptide (TPR) repeat protein
VNTDRTALPLEESFELEAPFEASPRLSATDPSLLRPLPLDVTLDETIEETSLTLPGGSAPRVDAPPPAPAVAPPSVGYLETPPRMRIEGLSAPSAPPAPTPETAALSSSTLAELYFRQGFLDKAIEVYQQLLQREPNNERGRARLGELRALPAPSVPPTIPPAAAAAAAPEDERTTRRRVIERAIARLEDLLLTIRRNAPAAGPR